MTKKDKYKSRSLRTLAPPIYGRMNHRRHLEAGEEGGMWKTCFVNWQWRADTVHEHVVVLTLLSYEHGKMRDAIWIT